MPYKIPREEFQAIAEDALRQIPKKFRKRLRNISIMVEDYPARDDARAAGATRHDLLGLFVGSGYPNKDRFFSVPSMPDRVHLYQKNLERYCASKEELADEIRKTLIHEIGHYFGLSEEELHELE
jgi:predicted Zn-dependent protease with MMP-like domain